MTPPLFDELADKLALAHRRVRELDIDKSEKARATRRLLAISDAAKHDLERAAKRLDVFLSDLEAGRVGAGDAAEHRRDA